MLVEPLVDLDGKAITLSIELKSMDNAVSNEVSINLKPNNHKQSNILLSLIAQLHQ